MALLDDIKGYNGIPASVTAYDADFTGWIAAGKLDLAARGVPQSLIDGEDERVKLVLSAYCRSFYLAFIGGEVADLSAYEKIIHHLVFRLSAEKGGTWDPDEEEQG
jgi:hypothetical protein